MFCTAKGHVLHGATQVVGCQNVAVTPKIEALAAWLRRAGAAAPWVAGAADVNKYNCHFARMLAKNYYLCSHTMQL